MNSSYEKYPASADPEISRMLSVTHSVQNLPKTYVEDMEELDSNGKKVRKTKKYRRLECEDLTLKTCDISKVKGMLQSFELQIIYGILGTYYFKYRCGGGAVLNYC